MRIIVTKGLPVLTCFNIFHRTDEKQAHTDIQYLDGLDREWQSSSDIRFRTYGFPHSLTKKRLHQGDREK